ncbi:MAG TPA: hypothetical protein VN670_09760 [Acidobacteriaceae bacterium]|nr:hypothetical protein [Acidobacteriaceae bacterium]
MLRVLFGPELRNRRRRGADALYLGTERIADPSHYRLVRFSLLLKAHTLKVVSLAQN